MVTRADASPLKGEPVRASGVRIASLVAFIVVMSIAWRVRGVPVDREQVLLWCLGGMALASLVLSDAENSRLSRLGLMLRYWLPLTAVLFGYDFARGAADAVGSPVQAALPAQLDRFLGMGVTIPERLQRWAYGQGGATRHWELVVSLLYLSHFIVPFATAAYLWVVSRSRWRAYTRRLIALTGAALLVFVVVPTAPPWLAAQWGVIEDVTRTAAKGLEAFGWEAATRLIEKGQASVNLTAAFPSLHAGYAALVATFFWPSCTAWARFALATYALAMSFILILTGEHWSVDILAAWALLASVHRASCRFEYRGRTGRAMRPEEERLASEHPVSQ